MADVPDTEGRPSKRARLDNGSNPATSTEPTAEAFKAALAPQAPSTALPIPSTTNKGDGDLEREIRAGITEYVSPDNLGFTGVLKQRYTDFLVNEISPSGEVLHLRTIGAGKQKAKQGKSTGASNGETKEEGQGEEADDAKEQNEEQKDPSQISEEDTSTLNSIFGETATSQVIALVRTIHKHPQWKAKEFKAVVAPPIQDKEARTEAHRTLRRIFGSLLESSTESDQSIRIKARPPRDRGQKQKKGNGRDDAGSGGLDGRRGRLPWEELGGEYLHFTLYKENKDTMEVIGFLGSITKSGPKGFGWAGTKDRRACTVQRVSVRRQTTERMDQLNQKLRNCAIGDFSYHSKELELGDLLGNEFVITLRDCHFQNEGELDIDARVQLARDVLSKAVRDFAEKGFINYYGLQRFGSFATSTDTVGIKLLQGDLKGAIDDILVYNPVALNSPEEDSTLLVSKDDRNRAQAIHDWRANGDGAAALALLPRKFSAERNIIQHLSSKDKSRREDRRKDYRGALMTVPRNLRLMYVHAYQSFVWNVVAGKRWTMYGDRVVEGDLVLVHEHVDKEPPKPVEPVETVDQDGELIINPAGSNSAHPNDSPFERARPLSAAEAESGLYNIFDVVLPQPGFDVEYPKNDVGEFYKEFMASERGGGLDPHRMRRDWKDVSLSGGYRKFLTRPLKPVECQVRAYEKEDEQFVETDLQKLKKEEGDEDGSTKKETGDVDMQDEDEGEAKEEKKVAVILKLQLSSSQYATMALRELMKAGGVKAYQPEFMGGR